MASATSSPPVGSPERVRNAHDPAAIAGLTEAFAITGPVIDTWLGTNFVAMLAQVGWGVARFDETVPNQD